MAADTILTRFRDLSSITSSSISDIDFTDKYESLAVELYNEIMDESISVTSLHTCGTYLKDEALANLATALSYQKIHRTKMYKDTGMLEWQRYMQQAYEIMYIINPTKIDYREGRDIYTIRDPDTTGKPYMYTIGRDSTGDSGSNIGT